MNLGIDASNIRSGGGLTHLVEILENLNPNKFKINKVFVWACSSTLDSISDKSWLIKKNENVLEKKLFKKSNMAVEKS